MSGTIGSGTIGSGSIGNPIGGTIIIEGRQYDQGLYDEGTYDGGTIIVVDPPPAPPPPTPIPPFVPTEPIPSVYALYVRDGHLRRVAEISDYTSFKAVLRYNDAGTWTLVLAADAAAAPLLAFIDNPDTAVLPPGIILTRDGESIFSGVVTTHQFAEGSLGDVVTVSGVDDNGLLGDCVAYPNLPGMDYSSQEADERTGDASSVAMQFVNVNAGPGAPVEHRIPFLELGPNYGYGRVVTERAQFQSLLELLKTTAADGGIRFRLERPTNEERLVFNVDHPSDRTAWVIFSREMGTLTNGKLVEQVSSVNAIIGGGPGDGVLRSYSEDRDDRSIRRYGPIAKFVDLRSIPREQLHDHIDALLDQLRERITVTGSPLETATTQYGRTYGLGDICTVRVGGRSIEPTISQVKIDMTKDGATILPSWTTSPDTPPSQLGGTTRALDTRISAIERTTGTPNLGFVEMFWDPDHTIPSSHWLCDGANGTPDLDGRFPLGAGSVVSAGAHGPRLTSNGESGDGRRTASYYDKTDKPHSGSDVELSESLHRHVLPYCAIAFVMRKG
jgi:hypothetical protein